MFLRIAVSYVVIFAIFYIVLALYERFVKKIEITNQQRVLYVAGASAVWPITIFTSIIFVIVKIVNSLKKF